MSDIEETNVDQESPTPEATDVPDASEMHVLEPSSLQFRTLENRLQVKLGPEKDWQDASAYRLFPLSDPDRWISVCNKEEKELGILDSLKDLSPGSAEALEKEMRRRYLVPQIERILATRDRFDVVEWTVETDRGAAVFMTRRTHENIQRPHGGRAVLTDVENNRYDIPDIDELDPHSRRLLEERL